MSRHSLGFSPVPSPGSRLLNAGATTVALLCGTVGAIVAFHPALWIGLFSYDADVARIGALYLHIVGPVYGC